MPIRGEIMKKRQVRGMKHGKFARLAGLGLALSIMACGTPAYALGVTGGGVTPQHKDYVAGDAGHDGDCIRDYSDGTGRIVMCGYGDENWELYGLDHENGQCYHIRDAAPADPGPGDVTDGTEADLEAGTDPDGDAGTVRPGMSGGIGLDMPGHRYPVLENKPATGAPAFLGAVADLDRAAAKYSANVTMINGEQKFEAVDGIYYYKTTGCNNYNPNVWNVAIPKGSSVKSSDVHVWAVDADGIARELDRNMPLPNGTGNIVNIPEFTGTGWGSTMTCRVTVYPWVGEGGLCLDESDISILYVTVNLPDGSVLVGDEVYLYPQQRDYALLPSTGGTGSGMIFAAGLAGLCAGTVAMLSERRRRDG